MSSPLLRAALASCLLGCAGAEASAERPDRNEMPAPCVRRDPSLRISAEPQAPVRAGTPVTYTLSISNESEATCEPEVFLGSVTPPIEGLGFSVEPLSVATPPLAGGETVEVPIVVESGPEEDHATYALTFFVRSQQRPDLETVHSATVEAEYAVREPEGCHVVPSRELLIRHTSVVDDPARTTGDGAWTFGHLMRRLAPSPEAAPALAQSMLESFASEQTINGFRVAARPNAGPGVLQPWPRTAAGELDLLRSPMRLLAIAHRLDLADVAKGRAGEGRFVYGVLDRSGGPMLFTLILEYALPANSEAEQLDWARAVHTLSDVPFPSAEYNDTLQALTDRYTTREALLRVRSNENSLGRDGRWEMREFHLSADAGTLVPAALAQTPDTRFNGSARLARYLEENRESVLREAHDTPASLDDAPFAAGALINELDHWQAPGIADHELRYKFSLNTCDGCHGGETFTSFFHVLPRPAGMQSRLSGFLTGIVVRDPQSGVERSFNELARRRQLLERSLCGE